MPLWLTLLCGLTFVLSTSAQTVEPESSRPGTDTSVAAEQPGDLDVAAIQARMTAISARTDIPAQERDMVLKQLGAAANRLEAAEAARKAAQDYAAILQTAPQTIAELNSESVPSPSAPPPDAANVDPIHIQLELASLQTKAVSLRGNQRELEQSLRMMATRPEAARTELTDLRRQLDQQQVAIPAIGSPLLAEATTLLNDATRQELSARIDKTEQELLGLPTREAIATARLDLTNRHITQVDVAIADLTARITAQRKQEAEQQTEQAEEFARHLAGQPAAIQDYAGKTADIRIALRKLSESLEETRNEQQKLQTRLDEVVEARQNAEQILAIGRISNESGRLLSGLKTDLLAHDKLESRIASRRNAIVDARLQRLQIRQELRALQPEDVAAARYLAENSVADIASHLALMTTLIEKRRAALTDMDKAQGRLIGVLSEANAVDSELMRATEKLRSLLNERLLWLPSSAPLGGAWLRQLGDGIVWLIAPSNWAGVPRAFVSTLRTHLGATFLLLAAVTILLLSRRRLAGSLKALAEPVGSRNDSFQITLRAGATTAVLALTWPLGIGTVSWLLSGSTNLESFPGALGHGLLNVAVVVFMLGLFIEMCRKHGVFVTQFGWDGRAR